MEFIKAFSLLPFTKEFRDKAADLKRDMKNQPQMPGMLCGTESSKYVLKRDEFNALLASSVELFAIALLGGTIASVNLPIALGLLAAYESAGYIYNLNKITSGK